jgi:hypothetical protein
MSTYVLNDTEVKLTGRTASRSVPGGKQQELVEVTPAEEDNGTWKKWVPKSTLFQIHSGPVVPQPRP